MSEQQRHKTQPEIESTIALEQAQLARELSQVEFFTAHTRAVSAQAAQEEIAQRAKERVERAVLADNSLHHVYVFDQPVADKTVKECVRQLTAWGRQDPGCAIELQINSPGGSIFAGFALIDFLRGLSSGGHKITAVAYGMAASMGGVILQAADVRIMGANSFLLLHEGSLFAAGDYGHVEDEYHLMKLLHDKILDLFTDRSKVNRAFIKKNWSRKDWWVPASEALKYGFVDEVR